ncbi:MAG: phosphatase PAP2 family protein, partial [Ramlibacter sp.]
GLADYVIAFIRASEERHPWTIELVNCALAMGNVAYMRWKSLYRRVRPSFLCPGLVPAFGPPGHPSFPSGHSTLGHLMALLLLEIPALRLRFGKFAGSGSTAGDAVGKSDLAGTAPIPSPLLWLAARLAKNRERLGVHYPSDSFAGRHLAVAMWNALLYETDASKAIDCPTLRKVIDRARAEWQP